MSTQALSASISIALWALSSTPQGVPESAGTATREHADVRIELSGPEPPIHVWAASEWTLHFENRDVDPMPFGSHLLEPPGFGGARVTIEIATGGKIVRQLASRNCCSTSNCGGLVYRRGSGDFIEPGDSAALPVVLHGEMSLDLAAYGRGDAVRTRFRPVFETPGSYSVTALLQWGGITVRSPAVAIEVAGAPAGTERALKGLEDLSRAGICIDVQGMYFNLPWTLLDRIAEFVEREWGTLYGAQLQLGLAEALLGIVVSLGDGITGEVPPVGTVATMERVRSLVPRDLPLHFGLERSLARLNAQLARQEERWRR